MSKYCTILASTVIALTFSTPVLANPNEVAVSYKDLNLGVAEDRAKLDRRLDGAAQDVCHVGTGFNDLSTKAVAQRCHKLALEDARQRAEVAVAQAQTNQQVASAK